MSYRHRIELDLSYRDPDGVNRGTAEGFVSNMEKMLETEGVKLRGLLEKGGGPVLSVEENANGKASVTSKDFENELPEIVAPNRASEDFSFDDLRATLDSLIEKLVALSKLKTDETMSELAQKRIETVKARLDRTHDEMAAKIQANLAAMKKAATNKLMMKIFGWIIAVALVVSAIFTAGATLTGFIAVAALQVAMLAASAALALASQILDATGTMDRWQKKLTAKFKEKGLKNAELRAMLTIQLPIMIAMITTGAIGGKAAGAAFRTGSTIAKIVTSVGTAASMASTAQQGIAIAAQYKAALAGADVNEVQAITQLIRQMLDEVQEELQEILEKIEELIGRMFDIIASSLDAQKEIAKKIGMMA